ncbi:MAG: OmpA family protein [Nitrospira sp.]|nr:OmpA family protein [Nitrospira sp.]
MNRTVTQAGALIVMGVVLLTTQGCGMKWLQADGEAEIPKISRGGSSGELSGFSNNPSEERLTQPKSAFSTMMNSPDKSARRFAEITKEERAAEKAAIEAGLQDVFFGYDQWTLSDAGMEALNQDVMYLKEHPRAVLRIGGHCDERGTSDYNLVLGDKRAKAALSYLVEAGVKSKQVSTVSYGKERPFCSDHDEACYQQNRRGHMLLTTKK